ncbi:MULTISPECIES: hypothetical protein [Enterobacteriaceae]
MRGDGTWENIGGMK